MPRPRTQSTDSIVERAVRCFWFNGYFDTSIDVLVRTIGVSRHRLYADFGGKEGLFEACLANYSELVVTPAYGPVEAQDANLDDVARYYDVQIARAECIGLPGPGCLMANTQTEVAPHQKNVAVIVTRHNERLRTGFVSALRNETSRRRLRSRTFDIENLATTLVIFTNGLWSFSRTVSNGAVLRAAAMEMLELVKQRLSS